MIRKFPHSILSDNIDEIEALKGENSLNDYLIVIFCQQGKMQVEVNDEKHNIEKDDAFICVPQCLVGHYMRTPDFEGKVLCAGRNLFNEVLSSCFHIEPMWWEKEMYMQRHPVVHLSAQQHRLLESYYQLLITFADEEQTTYRQRILHLMAQAMVFEVLNGLDHKVDTDNIPDSNNSKGDKNTGQQDYLFAQFMQILNRPNNTEREVQYYAHQLLITPKYLSKVCKDKSGKTASEWIDTVIEGHIRHYLIQTDMSIKEIAYQMDFPDVSFFCKYVRKHLGTTPLEFRLKEQKK